MAKGAWVAIVGACALGGVAFAEENSPAEAVSVAPTLPAPASVASATLGPDLGPAEKPRKKTPDIETASSEEEDAAKSSSAEPEVAVFGRILALGTADERSSFERNMGISQARIGVKAAFGLADAVLEAELAGRSLLRDAYLRLSAGQHVRFTGGQFKAPFMQRSLQSTWSLPRIGRGLVEDYDVDQHQLGGRRMGAMAELKAKQLRGLRVSGGVFQGAVDEAENRAPEDVAARISVRPIKALTVSTNGYAAAVAEGFKRFAAGGDAELELGRWSVTAEALVGRLTTGRFTSQTALVAYDLPIGARGHWVIQPTAGAEALQLRADRTGYAYGASVGLNALLDDRVRLQLQVQRMVRPGDDAPANDLGIQLGAKF